MYASVKNYLILFAGVFALSTSAIWVKIAQAPSAVMALYRLLFAAIVLLPFLLLNKGRVAEVKSMTRRRIGQVFAAGFFLALHYVLWFESLRFTSTASSTVIVCLQPLFSLAIERFIAQKPIKPSALVGCIVALCGCVIIGMGDFRISGESLLGDILAFVAAAVIAVYYFVGENVRKEMSAVTYSTTAYLVSALMLFIYALLNGDQLTGFTQVTWWSFVGIALVATIGGQFIFNLLLKKLPASAVTMGILGEPIGTCILAGLILKEAMTGQQLLGFAVIMLGMVIFFFPPKPGRNNG